MVPELSQRKRIRTTVTVEEHHEIVSRAALGKPLRRRATEEMQRLVLKLGRQVKHLDDRDALETVRQLMKALSNTPKS